MDNTVKPKAIRELKGMHFIIPDYQRGYRWTERQVMDLLDDINNFQPRENARMYCIQPLVVKRKDNEEEKLAKIKGANSITEIKEILDEDTVWEVIDGQQRLTSILIILNYLAKTFTDLANYYSIEYQIREHSASFLRSIDVSKKNDNIDFYYMADALDTVKKWFNPEEGGKKGGVDEEAFKQKLLEKVKFIWYETSEENQVTVFTRLNIGKIPLTNAELIKAMLLNKDYDAGISPEDGQLKLALQWDEIEHSLDNDEFWYFLNNAESAQTPTRIDLIFNIIRENREIFKYPGKTIVGNENKYKTFYYFYDYLEEKKDNYNDAVSEIWNTVLGVYYAFSEWYRDTEFYHYVGFLIAVKAAKLKDILKQWLKADSRTDFANWLKGEIKKEIGNINWDETFEYPPHNRKKTECKPLLLLFNVMQIVNENKNYLEGSKFQAETHRRFPFHMFKKENWDVEHIDSATENELNEEKDRKDYLKTSLIALLDFESGENNSSNAGSKEKLMTEICEYLKNSGDSGQDKDSKFTELRTKIQDVFGVSESSSLSEEDKNKIWNFTLLDSHTNRSYKNSIFPYKRKTIMEKSQGLSFEVIDKSECDEKDLRHIGETDFKDLRRIGETDFYIRKRSGEQAFVPQCTLNVFMKFYSVAPGSLFEWTKSDAEAYKIALQTSLKDWK